MEQEIAEERALGKDRIEEEGKRIRDDKLRSFEKRLNDMKKNGLSGDAEFEFADLLAEYGDKVQKVDDEMKAWNAEQSAALEDKLRQRREKRRREIEEMKKEREAQLN